MYGRQAGSNQGQQMLRRHGNLTPYARLLQWNVCWGWDSACSQFIITIIIQHLHQSNQPRSSIIKRRNCAFHIHWTIYNNAQLHARMLMSTADPIICPATVLSEWIFRERTHSVSILMVSICGYKHIQNISKNIITKAKKMKWTMFTGQHCKNSVEETILMAETFVSATSSTQH